ncbi:MAG TPA: HEAT repeat domain-containing protein [Bryobacteraceae bacterium]|jgi:hypothetical protein
MICDRIREQIPDCLAGRLDEAAREKVIEHLELCSACRAEMADLGVVWRGLGTLPTLEPDSGVRERFLEMLEAYQAGLDAARERAVAQPKRTFWTAGWWPSRAAWQAAMSCLLVAAGVVVGRYLTGPRTAAPGATSNPEIAQLQGQVENLRQLVALSMLQEQSPTARLRGVTYSVQMAKPDRQVEQALLYTVNHDANVNVRLSAVDALERFARGNPAVEQALVDAIPVQDSPLVQVALIELLVQLNDRDAAPELRKLSKNSEVDESVRQRAEWAIAKLEAQ